MGDGHHGDCEEAIERLYHFLDGELTDDKRRKIKKHLDDCPPCLEAFDFEADVRALIASKCRDHVPDHLRQRIAAALEQEQTIAANVPPTDSSQRRDES